VPFELQKHKRLDQQKKEKEMKLIDTERSKEEKPCVLEENRDRLMAVQLPQYSVLVYPAMC
jgi:hypothetical protein